MVPVLLLALLPLLLVQGSPRLNLAGDGQPAEVQAAAGGQEIHALAAAWPGRIAETRVQDGEWMLRIGDQWFAWAHGRMLPEDQKDHWQEYAAQEFYDYPLSLPELVPLDEATAAHLRLYVQDELAHPPRRSEEFLSRLLEAGNRAQTEAHVVKMEVAGFTVTVHEVLKDPLTRVSDELWALRDRDPQVAAFLRGLSEMNGYNYRFVEGTRSRSYHSYGMAVDLIPRSYGRKQPYWLWAMNRTPDWWTIPYEQRWMVPAAVVEAFERGGFVWGGKWLFFDTMHFEYRPDLLRSAREQARTQTGPAQWGDVPPLN